MEELQGDFSSYKMQAAYDLMRSVLLKEYPSNEVLKTLFGARTRNILPSIDWFWNNTDLVLGNDLRKRGHDPKEIFFARYNIENETISDVIDDLDFYVHTQQVPPRILMNVVYDKFADKVELVYRWYDETGLEREAGIPIATHPHNIAMTGYAMGFDYVGRASLAFHDVIEDLFNFLIKKYSLEPGIKGYDAFIWEIIPEELRMHVDAMTNKYDTIIQTIDELLKNTQIKIDDGRTETKQLSFNKENVLEAIIPLLEQDKGSMTTYLMKTYSIAHNLPDSPNFKELLKWNCYRDYVEDIAETCKLNNDFLAFDMKGLDLYFNGIGRESLKRDGKIKNALKQMTWVNKGYEIHTNYAPLNNHIMEVAENAFAFSQDFVARDFIKSIYKTSHFFRALKNMKRLTPVFFTDVDTDYTIKKKVLVKS